MPIDVRALANDPIIALGGFALGVLGILLAIIFYVKAKKEKVPCYQVRSNTLIEGLHKALDGLQLHYKGTLQERLTVTKMVFWNAGRETIDRRDLVAAEPIGIVCSKQLNVLDAQIIQASAVANAVALKKMVELGPDKNLYPIEFDYLDNKEFFVVQIVHTGPDDEEFRIRGKIKGVKRIERSLSTTRQPRFLRRLPFYDFVDKIAAARGVAKYVVSLSYLGFAGFGTWWLFHGRTEWYVWLASGFCYLAAAFVYYGSRHVPPVGI